MIGPESLGVAANGGRCCYAVVTLVLLDVPYGLHHKEGGETGRRNLREADDYTPT